VTILAVLRETRRAERRVAMVPSEVAKLQSLGVDLRLEAGAGEPAGYADDDYAAQPGVTVVAGRTAALGGAAGVLAVSPPSLDEVDDLPEGSVWLGLLPPATHLETVSRLRDRGITVFSFDLVPRTSRAQSMDALSSQASLAGYEAAIVAAHRLRRAVPMMMTAAGTIPPSRFLIIGAGVAGLQAIATAKRLGAAVTAYDVRPEAAEEVRSLGGAFLDLPLEARTGSGGYAAEQTADFLARQQTLISGAVARSDAVITTAAVPGRTAPRLLNAVTVEQMRPGSVVVDLAASSGGNCELTVDGQEVEHAGVVVIGAGDLTSRIATTASAVYARNVVNLLALVVHDGEVRPDFDDDIVAATCVAADGIIRHDPTRQLLQGAVG
jgi:NAD(P) transhydrogenase subunit alpha